VKSTIIRQPRKPVWEENTAEYLRESIIEEACERLLWTRQRNEHARLEGIIEAAVGRKLAVRISDWVSESLTATATIAGKIGVAMAEVESRDPSMTEHPESWLRLAAEEAGLEEFEVPEACAGFE
jgi:hypothetical protein